MKLTRRSTLREVALAVGVALARAGVRAVLTGGACASLHTRGRCVSKDVDFVVQGHVRQAQLDAALAGLGFRREADRYVHTASSFYVEFPPGPLAVGGDYRIAPVRVRGRAGTALALSPTDSCRDRLAAFYHWRDRQSLAVAVLIAKRRHVNLGAIRRWSVSEGHAEAFREFLVQLRERKVRAKRVKRAARRPMRTGRAGRRPAAC